MEKIFNFHEKKQETFPNGITFEGLIDTAEKKYDEYEMDKIPLSMQRNSHDYYYLSVYPGLMEMEDLVQPPKYPEKVSSVYIHMPFCSEICSFCSYFTQRLPAENNHAVSDYFEIVKKEIDNYSKQTEMSLKSIYFGGGTPSLIPPDTLDSFLGHMKSKNFLPEKIFGTFELHPEFFYDMENAQKFVDVMKKYGINRVSIGYQSSNEKILKDTKRRHDKDFLKDAVDFLKKNNLMFNIDLMYGMPDLSIDDWAHSLSDALSVKPNSITPYFFFLNKGTKMSHDFNEGKISLPSHKEIQKQHLMTQIILAAHDYIELPNDFFAKNDKKINVADLKQEKLPSDFSGISVGSGAYGYSNNTQFFNYFNLHKYKEAVEAGRPPVWKGFEMNQETLMRRDIMFSLKNSPYLNRDLFLEKYKEDPVEKFENLMNKLTDLGLITISEKKVCLTQKGKLMVEEIACQFKDPNVQTKKDSENNPLLVKHNFSPTYKKIDL